jgi:sec-independent protein translocase protein TatA
MFAVLGLSASEVLILLAVGLLLFGNRLPDLARSLGKGIVELQKGMRGIEEDMR